MGAPYPFDSPKVHYERSHHKLEVPTQNIWYEKSTTTEFRVHVKSEWAPVAAIVHRRFL